MFREILQNVAQSTPLVHNITNYVTVNDCANIILASGGSPIMADDISEVEDITSICSSLVINIGTLNERTIKSMIKAGRKANELGHPVVLDPVGAGASKLRNETIMTLMKEVKFAVIRGNISEIKFVAGGSGMAKGVDAAEGDAVNADNLAEVIQLAQNLSKDTDAVIAITGAVDIVADSSSAYVIKNGHPLMSKVTGTGCMLSTVIGSYVGANYESLLDATACAVSAMGICGELAYDKLRVVEGGTSTYRALIIDFMSKLNGELFERCAKIEVR